MSGRVIIPDEADPHEFQLYRTGPDTVLLDLNGGCTGISNATIRHLRLGLEAIEAGAMVVLSASAERLANERIQSRQKIRDENIKRLDIKLEDLGL